MTCDFCIAIRCLLSVYPLFAMIWESVNRKTKTLRTVGDKWSYLSEMKFGQLVQPFCVTLDNEGNSPGRSFSYKEDVEEYMKFLNEGLENHRKK